MGTLPKHLLPLTLSENTVVIETPRRVEKPWGYELIWAETDQYVGKVLHVNAGESLSLQYHEVKDETIFLHSGEMRFWVGSSVEELQEVPLKGGEAFRVVPGTLHRMEAVSDCDIFEASTPHLDDVVRIEDRYGRAPAD
jgi:mannose-6-phosphate isomerase-like protein (cupin superfamily)